LTHTYRAPSSTKLFVSEYLTLLLTQRFNDMLRFLGISGCSYHTVAWNNKNGFQQDSRDIGVSLTAHTSRFDRVKHVGECVFS